MIKWIGPVFDTSGYTAANRDYISALHGLSVDLKVQSMQTMCDTDERNATTELIMGLIEKEIPYDYVVHHYTPENIHSYVEKGKINIAYNTWETTALPKHWVQRMNDSVDAVFVPSKFNKTIYENSGIKVPIKIIPHCFNIDMYKNNEIKILLSRKENVFKFLSVFQWTERKNPIGLLKAYFSEFSKNDNVMLILKTYGSDFSSEEQERIREAIETLKNNMNLKSYPPVYFVRDRLTKNEIIALYKLSDCFVLASRGEGFGIPYAESALCGNYVIATGFGGQIDFLDDSFSRKIRYQLTPVSGMAWIPNYNAHMNWAEPDIIDLKKLMREIYTVKADSPQKFSAYQDLAKATISTNLNYKTIGEMLLKAIQNVKRR